MIVLPLGEELEQQRKKNRRDRTPYVFARVGLLINKPPGTAELPFV